MSIEAIIITQDGEIIREGDKVVPGETKPITITLGGLERVIIARCDEQDDGGLVADMNPEHYTTMGEGDSSVQVSMAVLDELENTSSRTGRLYEKDLVNKNGTRAKMIFVHNDDDMVQFN